MAEAATPELNDKTLTGDIRDFMLVWIRNMKKPFEAMSESDQRDLIEAVESSARELVGGVIAVVSGRGFEKAFVKLGKFSVGDGIEAKIITDRSERNLLNFNDFAGRSAMLIFADPAEFDGQKAAARIFRRQRDIEEEIADQKEADRAALDKQQPGSPPGDPPPNEVVKPVKAAKPPKEPKPPKVKPEPPPVKTTDVDTSKPRELLDPETGKTLDASKSNPVTRDRSLEDEHRLNENEMVDPITGEIIEIKPAATLDDLFSRPAEPEPDAVLIEEVLVDPDTKAETVWHRNPTQPEMPELPANLKRVKNPAPPGSLDTVDPKTGKIIRDPGEPETVTVNDKAPVAKVRTTKANEEPEELDDFPS